MKVKEHRRHDLGVWLAQVQTARGATGLDPAEIKRKMEELGGTGGAKQVAGPYRSSLSRSSRWASRLSAGCTFALFVRGDVFEALRTDTLARRRW